MMVSDIFTPYNETENSLTNIHKEEIKMSKTVRIEIWVDTEHLRAFPHVPFTSIKREENLLMFMYGDDEKNRHIVVNMNNVYFYEVMDE